MTKNLEWNLMVGTANNLVHRPITLGLIKVFEMVK